MRTTITIDADVAAAVAHLRRTRGMGVSAALNELARRGLAQTPHTSAFEQEVSAMGALIDVTNVGEALDVLEGPTAR